MNDQVLKIFGEFENKDSTFALQKYDFHLSLSLAVAVAGKNGFPKSFKCPPQH